MSGPSISRNSPCLCGSGQRYKNCCGAALSAAAGSPLASVSGEAALEPSFAQAFDLHQRGRVAEAAALYEALLARDPGNARALHYLGVSHYQRGDGAQAAALVERALAIDGREPMAQSNLGLIYRQLGRAHDALACFERAIDQDAGNALAFNNRGLMRQELKRPLEAAADFRHAIALQGSFAEAHVNLARTLLELREFTEAIAVCAAALRLDARLAVAFAIQGSAERKLGRHDAALASWERALAIDPGFVEVLCNHGGLLQELKRHEAAAQSFEQAYALRPGEPWLLGDWLHNRMHCCDWREFDALTRRARDGIDAGQRTCIPFALMMSDTSADCLLRSARLLTADRFPPGAPLWTGEPYAHERMRVAFLSADFRDHATSHLIAGVIEQFDRSAFELVGVYVGPPSADAWHARLASAFEHFIEASDDSDESIARALHDREIDVLVDLMGHTAYARTRVLALRPAPVQVNYLGFPGGMGNPYVDYLIADPTVIPSPLRASFDEQIVRMPHCYQPNDAVKPIAAAPMSRADCGLPDDAFVFCCFNGSFKITPDVFDIWMRLLLRVDGSVLWLLAGEAAAQRNLRAEASRRGIAPERLVFAPNVPLPQHLARHALAELFIDTLHCNAHTTASDALWAGLPLLTCAGQTFPSRVAASLLNAVGMPELITSSPAEYEALAYALATDAARLRALRATLARNRLSAPLFDTTRYTRDLESALRLMHERQRSGAGAADFDVPAA